MSVPRGEREGRLALSITAVLVAILVAAIAAGTIQARAGLKPISPRFTAAAAFDVSKPLRELAKQRQAPRTVPVDRSSGKIDGVPSIVTASGGAQLAHASAGSTGATPANVAKPQTAAAIPPPLLTFEGLSNQDNFNTFGFRVNPPDPNGEVGKNNYVEMINLVFAIYSKTGTLLLGPVDTGTLWSGFAIPDCTDPSGDPVVLYDQFADRWLLSQFTTRGLSGPVPNYNCVAVSTTGDPTGSYYRYAFSTQADPAGGYFFPDYPKYGVYGDSYILTTRDFGFASPSYGISVYGLERKKMLEGKPARAVQFFLDSATVPLNLIGDGLLPPDVDGSKKPKKDPAPVVGTQDDGAGYGATFDALNIWEFQVKWNSKPDASINLAAQLPVDPFDSIYPCSPTSRDCLEQPGIVNPAQYLDILSYRQRPTFRLAYRNLKKYDAMVTNQSVEASPHHAGVRWYEIHRDDKSGAYSVYQQGTYAPADGVHRWMGSAAMDNEGDIALGYSVVNGSTVYPGIRYTGRLDGDPLGQMTLGEGTIINGSGVQRTTNSRWGDYTDLTVDPKDDCTFWYVNEYYTLAGQISSTAGWQTRIADFRLPGCKDDSD